MTTLFTVGQANTPHHADKTKLLKPNLRPGAFYESLDDAAAGKPIVCGVNEMWPGILNAHAGYNALMPFPNNLHPMKLGNGFVWAEDIKAKMPPGQVVQRINTGTGPRDIHLPLMRFLPPGEQRRVPVLDVHAPRMDDDPDGNHRTHQAAIAKAQRVARQSGGCIVLGDPNGPVAALYRAAGGQCQQEKSGFIAAFGNLRLRNFRAIIHGVIDIWSDHLLLVADVVG